MATTSEMTLTFLDYSGEKSPAKFIGAVPATEGFATWKGLADALKAATLALSSGELHKESRAYSVAIVSNDLPTNVDAQREQKWLVTYRATTSEKLFRMEIPCAIRTANLLPASDLADLSATDVAAFVSAFEAFVKSPDNGTEAVEVVSIRSVGRNI